MVIARDFCLHGCTAASGKTPYSLKKCNRCAKFVFSDAMNVLANQKGAVVHLHNDVYISI